MFTKKQISRIRSIVQQSGFDGDTFIIDRKGVVRASRNGGEREVVGNVYALLSQ